MRPPGASEATTRRAISVSGNVATPQARKNSRRCSSASAGDKMMVTALMVKNLRGPVACIYICSEQGERDGAGAPHGNEDVSGCRHGRRLGRACLVCGGTGGT